MKFPANLTLHATLNEKMHSIQRPRRSFCISVCGEWTKCIIKTKWKHKKVEVRMYMFICCILFNQFSVAGGLEPIPATVGGKGRVHPFGCSNVDCCFALCIAYCITYVCVYRDVYFYVCIYVHICHCCTYRWYWADNFNCIKGIGLNKFIMPPNSC